MRVVKPSTIRAHAKQFPDAAVALEGWLQIARHADWESLQEVRADFPSADGVTVQSGQTVTIFNIRGNKYRLVTAIKYQFGMLYILRFMTHAEYDKNKWMGQL